MTSDHDIEDFAVVPSSEPGIPSDGELEFDDDEMSRQLIGLAASTGYSAVEGMIRHLFGGFACGSCGTMVELTPAAK